jgi:twitching motility protein PilT
VSAQLFQLLAQLDRPGATELVIATGRQVAVRINSAYQTLTASPVSMPQLLHLIRETQLAALVPAGEKVGDPVAVDLDGRALRAQFIRQGADVMLRIEHRPAPQPPARPTPPPRAAVRPSPFAREVATDPGVRPLSDVAIRIPRDDSSPPPRRDPRDDSSPPPRRDPRDESLPPRRDPRDESPARARRESRDDGPLTRTREPSDPALRPPEPRASSDPALRPPPREPPAEDRPALIDEPCEVSAPLAALIAEARRRDATDLHVTANRPVLVRTVGELVALDPGPRSAADVERLLLPLLGPARRRQLDQRGYVDLAVDVPGAGRLRTNISRLQGGLKGAFRLMMPRPPTLAELGLPAEVAKVTEHHQGLVVIAGPSGHGKTTTLAALVDLLNRADPIHILTIEDPVEIIHPRLAAVVSQREVGRHTLSFAAALKASLREDPDVIVIGELRDRETVEIALTAAETGHLVLATMSTPSAAKTIDRLIDMFPPADQQQVRASLGAALKAIVAQRLLPNAQGTGVVAAVELLVGMLALANMIRDNKLFQLPNLMQRGKAFGMIRLDDSLLELVRAGKLAEDLALRYADNKKDFAALLHPTAAPEPAKRGLFGRKDRE